MALGTTTLNVQAGGSPAVPVYFLDVSMVGESSYAAGGSAGFVAKIIAAAKAATPSLGIGSVVKGDIMGLIPIDTKGYQLAYDKANDKLLVRYFDYDAGADGAAIEPPDTTNLSGVTFRFTVAFS